MMKSYQVWVQMQQSKCLRQLSN